jgi:hypothetical protein
MAEWQTARDCACCHCKGRAKWRGAAGHDFSEGRQIRFFLKHRRQNKPTDVVIE